MAKLLKKQRAFIHELIASGDGNQTEAYMTVYGGDRKTARKKASALLKKPHVAKEYARAKKLRDEIAVRMVSDELSFDGAELLDVLKNPGAEGALVIGTMLLKDVLTKALDPNATTNETLLVGTGKGKQKITAIARPLTEAERASNRRDAMKLAGLGQTNINLRGSGTVILNTDAVDEDGEPIG